MSTHFPALALSCLGPPAVRVDGRDAPPEVLWRKHLALLVYLALSPDRVRARDHLMALLWPEKPDAKARHSLNEAVRRLRKELGGDRIVSSGQALALAAERLEVDVYTFERLGKQSPEEALNLVRGEFLDGFAVPDAPAFEEWLSAERRRLRDLAVRLLVELAERSVDAGSYADAAARADQALALDPAAEAGVRVAVRAAALRGDGAHALRRFHEFAAYLAREWGEQPGQELATLAERVRKEEWRRHSGQYWRLDPPMVGRRDVHSRLFAGLERAVRERAQAFVITGDPGLGKSRLLSTCAERALLSGATVAVARLLEGDHDAAWSTVRALARSGLADAPGMAATDPRGLRVLASVVPELAARFEPEPARDVGDVVTALSRLVAATAEERPVALLIDDAHWADAVSLAALGAVWRDLGARPAALVLTAQSPDERTPRALGALLQEVGRAVPGRVVRLEPFTSPEVGELARTMASWCTSDAERARLVRRVQLESGGNPFLAVTLLQGLEEASTLQEDALDWPPRGATLEATLPLGIPDLVQLAVVARIARLDPEATELLKAASVIGGALEPALLADLTGWPRDRLDRALDALERHRFITLQEGRYVFNGRLLAEVVKTKCFTAGERRRLRRRASELLAARPDLEAQALHAELLADEETGARAFQTAVDVVSRAIAAGALRTARRTLRAAERLADADPARRETLMDLRRGLERRWESADLGSIESSL